MSTGAKTKVDMKQQFQELYRPSTKYVAVVDVPEMNFLMVDGSGYPQAEGGDYQEAIEALYGLAYTIKFALKGEGTRADFTVMPLETLWWMHGSNGFDAGKPEAWRWTCLIAMPPQVTADDVKSAARQLKEKKDPPALGKVKFKSFAEGKAVQLMHIGPWSEETANIEKLHAYAAENGMKLRGKHHEIYMSDPRRVAPEKLKTIIRQPVR